MDKFVVKKPKLIDCAVTSHDANTESILSFNSCKILFCLFVMLTLQNPELCKFIQLSSTALSCYKRERDEPLLKVYVTGAGVVVKNSLQSNGRAFGVCLPLRLSLFLVTIVCAVNVGLCHEIS